MQHLQQQVQSLSDSNSVTNCTGLRISGRPPPATFSTFKLLTHSSVTPSRSSQARLAKSAGFVESFSSPARCISLAASSTLCRQRATAGMYFSFDSAWALISTDAAMYFFSTPSLAAAVGFSLTHLDA